MDMIHFLFKAYLNNDSTTYKIHQVIKQVQKKTIVCNDSKYSKFSDHIGLIPLVFVSACRYGSYKWRRK